MNRRYMHLIDGKPACFVNGMICFMRIGRASSLNQLCKNLRQLHIQQKLSREYRAQRGWEQHEYSFVTVEV